MSVLKSSIAPVLLGLQIFQVVGVPIITLSLIGAMVLIFYDFVPTSIFYPQNSCIGLYQVFYFKDYHRIILAAFVHIDEWHLYFNMVSLLTKGKTLEYKLGPLYFGALITALTVTQGIVYLVLNKISSDLMDTAYVTHCAAGFSGVLFAMKVVKAYLAPDETQFAMGVVAVPAKYLAWFELLLVQMISPNSSFNGHLSGILVGLSYVFGPGKWLLDAIFGVAAGTQKRSFSLFTRSSHSGTSLRRNDVTRKFGSPFNRSKASVEKEHPTEPVVPPAEPVEEAAYDEFEESSNNNNSKK